MEDHEIKRPKLVWVISIFMLLAASFTLFSFFIVFSGNAPLTPETEKYFNELGVIEWVLTALLLSANIIGAISLFRLKVIAFYFLAGALSLNILMHIWHVLSTSYVEAINSSGGIAGAYMGILIALAVVGYTWHLKNNNVLS